MNEIQGRKILIVGMGAEGVSTLNYLLKNYPKHTISLADRNVEALTNFDGFTKYSGENYLAEISKYDTVIRSPGISREVLRGAKHITSHTNIFFENCPGTVIAVTGTKGKSTTASLIYQFLKSQYDARLCGNIGLPGLNLLDNSNQETIFIYEISSFQLEDIHYSPHIAVVLAVTNDHIDWHKTLERYVSAKKNIVKFQNMNDFVFYNAKDKLATEIATLSKAAKKAVHPKKSSYKSALIGKGNEVNISMAIAVSKHFNIPEKVIKKTLSTFSPLAHRIEKVGTINGVDYYDDSIATNPSASLNGINAIPNLETVIIGGANKGFDYSDYIKEVSALNIKNIILMPDTGHEMKDDFEKYAKNSKILIGNTMEEAVKLAYENTSSGGAALLSPAATSFNMFKHYKERGDVFKKYVEELGN